MGNGMRLGIVWAATAAVSMGGFATTAQGAVDGHLQSHALRYAGMIESEVEPLVTVDYTNCSETSNTCARDTASESSAKGGNSGSADASDGSADQLDPVSVDYPVDYGGVQGIDGMSDGSVVDYSELSDAAQYTEQAVPVDIGLMTGSSDTRAASTSRWRARLLRWLTVAQRPR